MEHAKIQSNETLDQCSDGTPEILKLESPVGKTTTESILQGTLKDELRDSSKTPIWNEAKVPTLHSCPVPFSINVKVEEDI